MLEHCISINIYDKERMLGVAKHSVLSESVRHFAFLNYGFLLQYFDGIEKTGALLSTEDHFAECAFS